MYNTIYCRSVIIYRTEYRMPSDKNTKKEKMLIATIKPTEVNKVKIQKTTDFKSED